MGIRFSRSVTGLFVVAAMSLMAGHCWAVFHGLGPSKNDWGIKYDVAVSEAGNNKLNVKFTLADEGRLKPFYSTTVIAFSKQTDSQGGRSYDAKLPIELTSTNDGKRSGQVQISKDLADRAMIRILTLTVDGKRQSSASYYDLPLSKILNRATSPAVASPGTPAKSKVTR